ncbi:hypothetical protein M5D96_002973, partial [Drosophila gunungcola]
QKFNQTSASISSAISVTADRKAHNCRQYFLQCRRKNCFLFCGTVSENRSEILDLLGLPYLIRITTEIGLNALRTRLLKRKRVPEAKGSRQLGDSGKYLSMLQNPSKYHANPLSHFL